MMVHNHGPKATRDRAILLSSYRAMVKEFRPKDKLSASDIAKMTNEHLYQASRDLYNAQPIKKAERLARKLGLRKPERKRLAIFLARVRLRFTLAKAAVAMWWDRNHTYFMGVFSRDPPLKGPSPYVIPKEIMARMKLRVGNVDAGETVFKIPNGCKPIRVEVGSEAVGTVKVSEAKHA